jgi:hypothetical protein
MGVVSLIRRTAAIAFQFNGVTIHKKMLISKQV